MPLVEDGGRQNGGIDIFDEPEPPRQTTIYVVKLEVASSFQSATRISLV